MTGVKLGAILSVYFLNIVYGEYADYDGCSFELTDNDNITARYNLSWFHLVTDSFLVDDDDIIDWQYRFDICGYIPEVSWDSVVPDYCKNDDGYRHYPCTKLADDGTCEEKKNVTAMKKPASAVQVNSAHTVCWWLGSELDGEGLTSDYSVELYDKSNSGSGITYTINNGAWCEPGLQNRELRVELKCPDSPRYTFDPSKESSISEVVIENPQCIYTVSYESPLACPYDCIASVSNVEYSVCSGNGICAADPNAKKVQCLCDDGWDGDLCNVESLYDVEKVTSVHSSLITSVIICIVLLVIAIGVSLYLCHRIRLREEQVVSGTHGQYAQSMLDSDDTGTLALDDGTSMGIVGPSSSQDNTQSQAFDPNISVDPSIQNEIAQQHAKDVLQHGDDNTDINDNDDENDENDENDNIDQVDENNTNGPTEDDDNNETNEIETQDVEEAGNNTQREEEDLLGA